jgi:hypothetical protein
VLVISRCTVIATFRAPGYPPANLSGVYVSDGNELLLIDTGTVLTAAMKMALTSTENKRFRAQDRPGPIFMLGGAPTAHDVLSECGFLPKVRIGPHSDNPCLSGLGGGRCYCRLRWIHFFPVGTFCFNSSNQFSTTLICVGACACSLALSRRKRRPSEEAS